MTEQRYEELICKLALFGEEVEYVEYGISELSDWLINLLNGNERELNDYFTFCYPAFETYDDTLYVMSEFLSNYRCGAYYEYNKVPVPNDIAEKIYKLGNFIGNYMVENTRHNKKRNISATKRGLRNDILNII